MKKYLTLTISVLVLGILAGAGAGLLSLFLGAVERLFLHFEETMLHPSAAGTLPVQRLLSVLIGGCIAAVVWYFLRKKNRIPKITEVMAGKKMPFGATVLHVCTQIFFVGTGGSIGRELAPRELGALLAQKWETVLVKLGLSSLSAEEKSLMVAAAAGAGFSGAYIAPLTGMFFCIEILHRKISLQAVSLSLSMSIIAMLVGAWMKGNSAYYYVGRGKFSLLFLVFVLVMAPICGLVGAYFRKSFLWAEKNQTQTKQILWQLPAAALVTGLISLTFPQIMGNGRALAQMALDASASAGSKMIFIFLLLALLKGVMTVLTIRAGASGGTLAPSIAIGASLGAVAALLIPGMLVWQGALLGAVALLASAQQAPLMALFMMIEISHLPLNAVVPLGLGVALSTAISQLVLKRQTVKGLEDE
ncbi:chloride channel protein [Lactovum odontotermitis]